MALLGWIKNLEASSPSDVLAITMASFQASLISVSVAVGSGDYATARAHVADAEIALSGLPLVNVAEGTTTKMRRSLVAVRRAILSAQRRSTVGRYGMGSRLIP